MASVKYDCLACHKQVTATKNNRYRSHSDGNGEPCGNSSVEIPEHLLAQPVGKGDDPDVPREGVDFAVCPQCERKVKLTRLGYFAEHTTTLKGGDRCEVSGVRNKHARKTETVALPGDGTVSMAAAVPSKTAHQEAAEAGLVEPQRGAEALARMAGPAETIPPPSPESTPTSEPSSKQSSKGGSADDSTSSAVPGSPEGPASVGEGPWPLAPAVSEVFQQPLSPFFQPGPIPVSVKTVEAMTERGREIATRLREIFYSYVNRNSSDNRSAQATLGPSEIGSPCDRQLAMKLMGVPAVNPQESWAPFVGTAVHASLAEMFEWANGANSGRFAVEMPLTFGSTVVPRGTGDLLDRVLFMFLDHKLMGKYSLKKLIEQGPSDEYRVQLHTYAYGAERAGEKVKEIALVGWPREESSLQNLYVHIEPYDRQIALDAIARVERLHREVQGRLGRVPTNVFVSDNPLEVAKTFGTGDACRWCPFHNKADKRMERGCPGR